MDLAGDSHRVPLEKWPLKRLARQLLTAACLSALCAPEGLASEVLNQPGSIKVASSANSAPNFAVIKADRQGYDQQLGRFVATGNVEARFNGWRLLADRIELAEESRSVYASGQIRLIKGDQYLQASRLRYSDLEGSGELDNVYGVIDQDSLTQDLNSQEPKAKPTISLLTSANQPLPVRHSAQILATDPWCGCFRLAAAACPPCQHQPAALAVSSPHLRCHLIRRWNQLLLALPSQVACSQKRSPRHLGDLPSQRLRTSSNQTWTQR
jgi:Organic solvent tolerance protein OstA